ncbi:MAG: hypothetical protein H6668_23630 [Ardenticatenaceae bacterium]|nr:hypothetical protein [Ardenticatenaceae bacterium]
MRSTANYIAVIDEQHRFGWSSEPSCGKRNSNGNRTAQPPPAGDDTLIPRTLALSLYGDLDPSVLDEMPPGLQEIKTRWLRYSERERAHTFIKSLIKRQQQAYIIYPLVEETDKSEANGGGGRA